MGVITNDNKDHDHEIHKTLKKKCYKCPTITHGTNLTRISLLLLLNIYIFFKYPILICHFHYFFISVLLLHLTKLVIWDSSFFKPQYYLLVSGIFPWTNLKLRVKNLGENCKKVFSFSRVTNYQTSPIIIIGYKSTFKQKTELM